MRKVRRPNRRMSVLSGLLAVACGIDRRGDG
jgi:hypothetical protein